MAEKRVLLVLAGAADLPREGTPLADAETPGLGAMARAGRAGTVSLGGAAAPWDGFTALLGVEAGAAALGAVEALGAGIDVPQGSAAWRADFATVDDGGLRDPRAGRVTEPEAAVLLDAARGALPGVALHRLEGHRNLAVAAGPGEFAPSPWEMVGRRPLSSLSTDGRLRTWFEAAHAALAAHDVNSVRLDLLENPANALWFHGAGGAARPGTRAALGGTSVRLVGRGRVTEGLARVLGWTAAVVDGDDDALAAAALAALDLADLVVVRTESVLWATASGGAAGKRDAISAADARLVRPILGALEERDAFTFAVAADSVLDTAARALVRGPVPAVLVTSRDSSTHGAAARSDPARFTEIVCERSGVRWDSGGAFAADVALRAPS